MLEALKQTIFTGIGLATVTGDKIDALVEEFTKQANLSEQQVDEFKSEVNRRSDAARADLEKLIDEQIDHAFVQAGIIKGELKKSADQAGNALQEIIDDRVNAALDRVGIARSEDIVALRKRIELLETNNK